MLGDQFGVRSLNIERINGQKTFLCILTKDNNKKKRKTIQMGRAAVEWERKKRNKITHKYLSAHKQLIQQVIGNDMNFSYTASFTFISLIVSTHSRLCYLSSVLIFTSNQLLLYNSFASFKPFTLNFIRCNITILTQDFI